MSESKAVLWDMDGTLINSEELHWIAWRDTMAKEGFVITREQFLSHLASVTTRSSPLSWAPRPLPSESDESGKQRKNDTASWYASKASHLTPGLQPGCAGLRKKGGCKRLPRRHRVPN